MDEPVKITGKVREFVVNFLKKELGVKLENISDDMRLKDDLQLGRLDLAMLCVRLENAMFIRFNSWPDDEITLGEFVQEVCAMSPADKR